VLGDLAQGTAPAATASWPALLGHLGKADADLRELRTGYRVPRQILDYANQLLGALAPGLAPASSLRQDPAALAVRPVTGPALPGALASVCAAAQQAAGSTAVIAADDQVAALSGLLATARLAHQVLDGQHPDPGAGLLVIPVTLAKGLEFDHVIVVEPARIVAAEARGLHRLYVALTRAVSRLTVLHSEPLPTALSAPM
ncbi:MAG TPA: ATP-binding domain-containing protein, partial [Streptosporangiaceae bacterium]